MDWAIPLVLVKSANLSLCFGDAAWIRKTKSCWLRFTFIFCPASFIFINLLLYLCISNLCISINIHALGSSFLIFFHWSASPSSLSFLFGSLPCQSRFTLCRYRKCNRLNSFLLLFLLLLEFFGIGKVTGLRIAGDLKVLWIFEVSI